ncbi:MAG TPA: protease inhibitor I42 family protein [Allosphingosinicella sp.]|jgi:hypothetical protein
MADPSLPKRLDVTPGRPVTIAAPGHGIGGYVWTAEVESGPGQVEEIEPQAVAGAIGAGATGHFRLRWLGADAGVVRLSLKRPWEERPVEVHRINIEPSC